MENLRQLWERALRPAEGFRARALEAPALREAVVSMLRVRTPVALLELILGCLSLQGLYGRLISPEGELWKTVLGQLPEAVDPAELHAALAGLPPAPSLHALLPLLVVLAPLAVLGLWLHDATFDHLALWMLGGLRHRKSFRLTLVADAEALKVGALGAGLGLLGAIPGSGLAPTLLLLPVTVYFWILRGYALAAWHGCPAWKGITATLVHVALVILWVVLFALACILMVILAL